MRAQDIDKLCFTRNNTRLKQTAKENISLSIRLLNKTNVYMIKIDFLAFAVQTLVQQQ